MCFEVNDIANVITRNAQRLIIFIVINPVFLTAEFSAQVNGIICYFVLSFSSNLQTSSNKSTNQKLSRRKRPKTICVCYNGSINNQNY